MSEQVRADWFRKLGQKNGIENYIIQRNVGVPPNDKMIAEVFQAVVGGLFVF